MTELESLWRDPLSSPADRFPLGPPAGFWSECDDEPSATGVRPFSLRGVTPALRGETEVGVVYSYDPDRQVGLVRDADGRVVPLTKHTKPGPTPGATTGTGDGQPSQAPPEEMGPNDYQTD